MAVKKLSDKDIEGFQRFIWSYYRNWGRKFSWRENPEPYRVLVSEFMLQQTQTFRVETKIREFLDVFPNLESLARASLPEVLKIWVGLGYNRRGINLHKTSQIILRDFYGIIPSEPEVLKQLPGIGEYTSCSIPTFSFNIPTVFIETNIRRVFIYHFTDPREEQISEKFLLSLVAQCLDSSNAREWYYGLMDYGSQLKGLLGNPNLRSRIYRKQSPFEGSLRQVRGALLRVLTKEGTQVARNALSLVEKDLRDSVDYQVFLRATRGLESDGILEVREGEKGESMLRISVGDS